MVRQRGWLTLYSGFLGFLVLLLAGKGTIATNLTVIPGQKPAMKGSLHVVTWYRISSLPVCVPDADILYPNWYHHTLYSFTGPNNTVIALGMILSPESVTYFDPTYPINVLVPTVVTSFPGATNWSSCRTIDEPGTVRWYAATVYYTFSPLSWSRDTLPNKYVSTIISSNYTDQSWLNSWNGSTFTIADPSLARCYLYCVIGGYEVEDYDENYTNPRISNRVSCSNDFGVHWHEATPLPTAMYRASAVQYGTDLLVIGGIRTDSSASILRGIPSTTNCSIIGWEEYAPASPLMDRFDLTVFSSWNNRTQQYDLWAGGGKSIVGGLPLRNLEMWISDYPKNRTAWKLLKGNLPAPSNTFTDVPEPVYFAEHLLNAAGNEWSLNSGPCKLGSNCYPMTLLFAGDVINVNVEGISNGFSGALMSGVYNPYVVGTYLNVPKHRRVQFLHDTEHNSTPIAVAFDYDTGQPWRIDISPCWDVCPPKYYTLGCRYSAFDAVCMPCKTCEPGTFAAYPCSGTTLTYGDTVCQTCKVCGPGQAVLSACNATHDTECGYAIIKPLPMESNIIMVDPNVVFSIYASLLISLFFLVTGTVILSLYYSDTFAKYCGKESPKASDTKSSTTTKSVPTLVSTGSATATKVSSNTTVSTGTATVTGGTKTSTNTSTVTVTTPSSKTDISPQSSASTASSEKNKISSSSSSTNRKNYTPKHRTGLLFVNQGWTHVWPIAGSFTHYICFGTLAYAFHQVEQLDVFSRFIIAWLSVSPVINILWMYRATRGKLTLNNATGTTVGTNFDRDKNKATNIVEVPPWKPNSVRTWFAVGLGILHPRALLSLLPHIKSHRLAFWENIGGPMSPARYRAVLSWGLASVLLIDIPPVFACLFMLGAPWSLPSLGPAVIICVVLSFVNILATFSWMLTTYVRVTTLAKRLASVRQEGTGNASSSSSTKSSSVSRGTSAYRDTKNRAAPTNSTGTVTMSSSAKPSSSSSSSSHHRNPPNNSSANGVSTTAETNTNATTNLPSRLSVQETTLSSTITSSNLDNINPLLLIDILRKKLNNDELLSANNSSLDTKQMDTLRRLLDSIVQPTAATMNNNSSNSGASTSTSTMNSNVIISVKNSDSSSNSKSNNTHAPVVPLASSIMNGPVVSRSLTPPDSNDVVPSTGMIDIWGEWAVSQNDERFRMQRVLQELQSGEYYSTSGSEDDNHHHQASLPNSNNDTMTKELSDELNSQPSHSSQADEVTSTIMEPADSTTVSILPYNNDSKSKHPIGRDSTIVPGGSNTSNSSSSVPSSLRGYPVPSGPVPTVDNVSIGITDLLETKAVATTTDTTRMLSRGERVASVVTVSLAQSRSKE